MGQPWLLTAFPRPVTFLSLCPEAEWAEPFCIHELLSELALLFPILTLNEYMGLLLFNAGLFLELQNVCNGKQRVMGVTVFAAASQMMLPVFGGVLLQAQAEHL